MIVIRLQAYPTSLFLLLVLLALVIESTPINYHSSRHATHFKRSTHLLTSEACHSILAKRAVGGIPISSAPVGATVRQAVTRRAVGSVADSGGLCDHLTGLKTATPKLRGRSVPTGSASHVPDIIIPTTASLPSEMPVIQPVGISNSSFSKRSIKSSRRPPPKNDGKPDTDEKWARARPW